MASFEMYRSLSGLTNFAHGLRGYLGLKECELVHGNVVKVGVEFEIVFVEVGE